MIQTEALDLQRSLKQFFGYDQFRPGQQQIIEACLNHQDVMVVMPTGGGKSLCFQLPALLQSGLTIVVSPLIALMQDQVEALQDNGIGATFLNSSIGFAEARSRIAQIESGVIKLLYVAPERLLSDAFLPLLDEIAAERGIAGFAIDEAHCVSEWGHDFRPEYRQLSMIRQRYSSVPVMALTATATERVRQDILQQLRLRQPLVHIASFNRTNLYYEVRPKARQSYADLLRQIQNTEGSGIVYCLSRRRVDETADRLQQDGIAALPYHAGLSDKARRTNQTRFLRDDVRVMVATIAFGMGINKPDVRFVIHYDLPRNIESYYQESGRAGRDGEPAHCTLMYSPADIKRIDWIINQKVHPHTGEPLEHEQRIARQQLRQVIDYAESTVCRRTIQLSYFSESFPGDCGQCDNCLHPQPVEDWTIEAQKFLSCVARCREHFGMSHIIDVLRGSRKQRIRQYKHDQLSTYGIGKDRSLDAWRLLGRSLLQQQLVDETSDGFPVLKLNTLSWEVMRGQRKVHVAVPPEINEPPPVIEEERGMTPEADMLLRRLRALRKRLADQQSVPPYVVFAESSLRLMAQRRPQTLTAFSQISGVGSRKLEQYGQLFTEEIRAFCEEHGLPTQADTATVESMPTAEVLPTEAYLSSTHLQTLKLHQDGLSPEEIAARRNVKARTVYDHLACLIESGQPVYIDGLVAPERQTVIWQLIEKTQSERLKLLKEELGDEYSYDEIRLVLGAWRWENKQKRAF
ncbi:MAG: DNA helicase RecQ [Thainema sp.]